MGYTDFLSEKSRSARKAEMLAKFNPVVTESAPATTKEQKLSAYNESVAMEQANARQNIFAEQRRKERQISEMNNSLLSTLLTESFFHLYKKCVEEIEELNEAVYLNTAKTYISNIVEGIGPNMLYNRMATESFMLSDIHNAIARVITESDDEDEDDDEDKDEKDEDDDDKDEKKHDKEHHKHHHHKHHEEDDDDEEEEEHKEKKIDSEQKSKFFDDLDNAADVNDVVDSIKTRVSDSMSEFITANTAYKAKIEDVLDDIKDRTADKEVSESAKEVYKNRANLKISRINESMMYNTLGAIVHNITESSYKSNEMKQMFYENGSLNLDRVVNQARTVYTVLEMMNTAKVKKFKSSELADIVDSFRLSK